MAKRGRQRGNQKGTKLLDVGDAWRLRYTSYFIDENGEERKTKATEYLYKREHPTLEAAQAAAAKIMEHVNDANARLRGARLSALARLGYQWLADAPAVTQGLAPLDLPENEFQRCRKVTLRNGTLYCEIDKNATYSLAEAYGHSLHTRLASIDSDLQMIEFVREWGPIFISPEEVTLGDMVENSLAGCWMVQHEIKANLDALSALRSGRGEREAFIQLVDVEIEGLGGDAKRSQTLQYMGKNLGIQGDVLEWAAIVGLDGIRDGLEFLLSTGLYVSCTLNFLVEQDGRRRVRAGWTITSLEGALTWMIWFDEFTGRVSG